MLSRWKEGWNIQIFSRCPPYYIHLAENVVLISANPEENVVHDRQRLPRLKFNGGWAQDLHSNFKTCQFVAQGVDHPVTVWVHLKFEILVTLCCEDSKGKGIIFI